jgi:hypothetical protein
LSHGIIAPDLWSCVFDSAAEALQQLRGNPLPVLPEADLQSHLFLALFNGLRDDLDSDRIGLHCQPRFFPSPDDRSGKRYPDLCILDRSHYFLASRRVSTKGFQIHGPSIQVEIKLRRLNDRGEQLADWIEDLIKLACWRDCWYDKNRSNMYLEDMFYPLFIVFSHLPIDETSEWDVLRRSAETLGISVIACDHELLRQCRLSH